MDGHIAGAYRCKADERLYTYDVDWEIGDHTVRWRAAVYLAHATSLTSGALPFASGDDIITMGITRAIERWIEDAICTGGALPVSREWGR